MHVLLALSSLMVEVLKFSNFISENMISFRDWKNIGHVIVNVSKQRYPCKEHLWKLKQFQFWKTFPTGFDDKNWYFLLPSCWHCTESGFWYCPKSSFGELMLFIGTLRQWKVLILSGISMLSTFRTSNSWESSLGELMSVPYNCFKNWKQILFCGPLQIWITLLLQNILQPMRTQALNTCMM